MLNWDEFVQQMSENRDTIEKSVVITHQCLLLILIIYLINKYTVLPTKKLLLLITLEVGTLLPYNLLAMNEKEFQQIKEETLLIIYESKIKNKKITENDISKIAFKYLYYDLPIRLFVRNVKKILPIMIAIPLFGKIVLSKKQEITDDGGSIMPPPV